MITRSLYKKLMLNSKNRIIFYDFETSGFNPYNDSIIEIGATDNLGNTFNVLINFDGFLKPKITQITGIDNKLLKKEGINPKLAFNRFYKFINSFF